MSYQGKSRDHLCWQHHSKQESFQYLISQYGPVDDYISLIVKDTIEEDIKERINNTIKS